jgi:Leucine-rich repeat (LRR) protein
MCAWPAAAVQLPLLTTLDLGGNQLTGTISSAVTLLNSLEELDLSSNQLSGTLPYVMAILSRLGRLSISDNCRITGTIPEDFRCVGTGLHRRGGVGTVAVSPHCRCQTKASSIPTLCAACSAHMEPVVIGTPSHTRTPYST